MFVVNFCLVWCLLCTKIYFNVNKWPLQRFSYCLLSMLSYQMKSIANTIYYNILLFREYSSQHPWSSSWGLPLLVSCHVTGSCSSYTDEGKFLSFFANLSCKMRLPVSQIIFSPQLLHIIFSLHMSQVVHQACAHLWFLYHVATRGIFTSPCMGC